MSKHIAELLKESWEIEYAETQARWPEIVNVDETYDDGSPILICSINPSWPKGSTGTQDQLRAEAIARLLKAAPKMLEALKEVAAFLADSCICPDDSGDCEYCQKYYQVIEVIAEIEGE